MDNVSLQYNSAIKPQQQKTLKKQENQPEFSAVDKDKIKQDAVEIAQQGHEAVKENWIVSTMKNVFHIEDPKKFITSLGLTLATVAGLAFLGNKSVNKMADLGIKVDDFLANNKLYQNIGGFFENAKNKIIETLKKSKTMEDIIETMKTRRATPKADLTRGYGRGFVSIFSLTPVDIIKTSLGKKQNAAFNKELGNILDKKDLQAFKGLILDKPEDALNVLKGIVKDEAKAQEIFNNLNKTNNEILGSIKKLVGENKANGFFKQITDLSEIKDNRKFCSELTEAIADNFNLKDASGKINKQELLEKLKTIKSGKDFAEFQGVTMDQGNFISTWWPVNIIDSVGKKLFNKNWKGFGKGNLGDSLIKFNAVNGSLADTKLGSLVQNSILVPTESISNFVNDKSGLGAFLCSSIMSLYNNVQDAPKDKKAATVADDYIGTMGSIAISTPLAFATTYGLASLKNLEGNTLISKGLKTIGKFFGMGLDKIAKDGTITKGTTNPFLRFGGGALRFILIMFVFSNMFSKPIRGAIHKIFGKPYNKAEEEQKAKLEAQKNTIIPELGITQGELIQKIQNNPKAIEKIQSDPKLAQALGNNPKLLLDFLDGKEINFSADNNQTAQNKDVQLQMSPYNTQFINNKKGINTSQTTSKIDSNKSETNIKSDKLNQQMDTATYIPSSDFIAPATQYSNEETNKINQVMQNADKVLKRAEKYI